MQFLVVSHENPKLNDKTEHINFRNSQRRNPTDTSAEEIQNMQDIISQTNRRNDLSGTRKFNSEIGGSDLIRPHHSACNSSIAPTSHVVPEQIHTCCRNSTDSDQTDRKRKMCHKQFSVYLPICAPQAKASSAPSPKHQVRRLLALTNRNTRLYLFAEMKNLLMRLSFWHGRVGSGSWRAWARQLRSKTSECHLTPHCTTAPGCLRCCVLRRSGNVPIPLSWNLMYHSRLNLYVA